MTMQNFFASKRRGCGVGSCFLGACLLVLLALAPRAHAGGFENARFGSERGHAVTPTPLAVYYNPAALSATRKLHLAFDGVLALHGQRYERTDTTVPEPEDAQGANLGNAKSLDVLGAPTLAASVRLGDFALGAGLFVPFGGFVRWQGNDAFNGDTKYPGAQDGRARWHAIDASTAFIYLSAGASYLIRPARLSFGVGVNAIYGAASLARAQTPARDDDVSAEGRSLIDASAWLASFSVGVMWEALKDRLWIRRLVPGAARPVRRHDADRRGAHAHRGRHQRGQGRPAPGVSGYRALGHPLQAEPALRAAPGRRLPALERAGAAVRDREGRGLSRGRGRQRAAGLAADRQPSDGDAGHLWSAPGRQLLVSRRMGDVLRARLRQQRHPRAQLEPAGARRQRHRGHAGRARAAERALRSAVQPDSTSSGCRARPSRGWTRPARPRACPRPAASTSSGSACSTCCSRSPSIERYCVRERSSRTALRRRRARWARESS